jgi:hypothetical protein
MRGWASSRSMSRLRACWVNQAPVGCVVTPRMCTRRVACSMTKNALSRCRLIVSTWNRSQAEIVWARAWRNRDQVGPRAARRRVDARVEHLPHGGGADLVAESDEFAVHAPIPPGRIFGGQAHGQGADTGGNGRSACLHGWGGPAAADELAVPAQDGGRRDQESVTRRAGSSRARAAIMARSVQLIRGRGVRRCRTAS